MPFHWLSCDCLSLAELLPGKEKIFLLVVAKMCHFLLEMQGVSLPVGICIDMEWYLSETSCSWSPDSILVRFPFKSGGVLWPFFVLHNIDIFEGHLFYRLSLNSVSSQLDSKHVLWAEMLHTCPKCVPSGCT